MEPLNELWGKVEKELFSVLTKNSKVRAEEKVPTPLGETEACYLQINKRLLTIAARIGLV